VRAVGVASSHAPEIEVCARVRRATTKRHKVTVVGLGAMGRRHARVLRELGDRYELVGGFDVRPDTLAPDGLELVRSEAEAIARSDLLVVATPIEAHVHIVASALAAGRHVLVEKPLCATAADANALVAGSRSGGRLFVGHSERFNPVVRALARLLRSEDVVAIDLRRVGPTRQVAFGVLINLGVHDLDLVGFLGGGGVILRGAAGGALPGGTGGEDYAHVLVTTASGSVGHLFVDRTAPTKQRTIRVTTRRWRYEGDLLMHRLVRTGGSTAARADVPLPLEEPLVAQAVALADALDGSGGREIATGLDGACAVALAERAAADCAPSSSTTPNAHPGGLSELLGAPG